MPYNPAVKTILDLLEKNHCEFKTFEHAPVTTSEDAAKLRPEYTLHQGAKAIIVKVTLRDGQESFGMLVFPADMKFKSGLAKKALGAKELSFATEQEIFQLTNGVERGGVPPFGNIFNLRVIADESLFENEKIIFNAGDRSFSIAMNSADYKKLVHPEVAKIIL
jgi:prolyl-tRNA editing enzyme YbaK/EbsC (Cys-tRNA(Pro) deacylase)